MPKKKRKKRCLPVCCSAPSPDELRHTNEVESGNSDHRVCPKSSSFSASGIDVSTLDQIDSQDPAQDLHLSLALEPSSEISLEGQDTKVTSVAAESENTGTPSRYAQLGTGLPPVDEVERSLDADFEISAAPAPEPAPAPYPPATRSSESKSIPLDRPASSGSDCSSDADTRKTFWAGQDFRTEREQSSTPRRPNRVLAMARESHVGLTRELFPSPPPKKKAVRRPVKMCTPDTSSSELSSDAEMYRLLGLEKPKSGKYKIDGVSLRRASAKTNLPSVFINNSDSLVDSQLSNSGSSTEPELCKLLDMSKSTDEDDSKPVDALKKGKPLPPVKHMRDLDSPPKVLIDNSPKETKFLKTVMNGSCRAKSPLAPIPTSHTEREEIPQDVSEFLPSKIMSTRGAFASAGSAIFQEEKNIHSLRIMGKPSQRSSDVRIRSFNNLDTRTSRGPDPVNTAESNRRIESVCPPTANPRPSLHPSPPDRKAPETGGKVSFKVSTLKGTKQ
ncbi:uncharacterized protein LOC124112341 isoform X2 [Haliotis rufescens]|uniref:uncharacterized protein LOC124112341 isoform X2 n=1 Tax=Haliotis rufescens TaxID=6454 RepID=UPI00201EFB26|nr:uncharacterized protein LOC124112341 isoform X2 [Haliotis rufescens]